MKENERKLVVICSHFATGGMPQIVETELLFRQDWDCHLFIRDSTKYDVQLKRVRDMEHVTVHPFGCDILYEVQELGVNFIVSHGTGIYREQLQRAGIHCINVGHSPQFWESSEKTAPMADYCLAVSGEVKGALIGIGVRPEDIEKVNTPIEIKQIDPLKKALANHLDKKFRILHVGLFCENKNQKGAVKIFSQIADKIPNAALVLVGGLYANFADYWENWENNLSANITVTGEIADLLPHYSAADLFISTSHSEGCSTAIREAAANGLPCVISDIEGNRRSFDDAPFIFASLEDDGRAFVDAINFLYNNPKHMTEMGKLGREYIAKKYSPMQYIHQTDKIYQRFDVPRKTAIRAVRHQILIKFDSKALGDTLAWLPAVYAYQKKHNVKVKLFTFHNDFLKRVTDLDFIDDLSEQYNGVRTEIAIGCFGKQWRLKPLKQIAGDILEVEDLEPLRFDVPIVQEDKPYVCISEWSTMQAKLWNRKGGWEVVIDFLKNVGYNVYSISSEGLIETTGAIDLSGRLPLFNRAKLLAGAKFFIGVSSGLAWLANAVGTHVFMIDGMSYSWVVFEDNITHIERFDVCRGCINQLQWGWEKHWDYCPSGLDFQCTKHISPQMVIDAIIEEQVQMPTLF